MKIIKDSYNREICEDDIVVCNGKISGWVFKNEEEYFIGWDLTGPSCEDCSPLEEFLDKYSKIKVIGRLYR